ncbi:MAG: phosphoenolpyruvate synthase [Candidatus Pacebacteria bacterium]|nr:phosphoenolpyruvate synthase [Candidatus Paceibacterota bacterium]MDD3919066.1 phosphoenolpyruvate synthase [Candidatus Paceibacterota bacterium]
MKNEKVLWFSEIRKVDVAKVGGKNASLGEMYSLLTQKGINIPNGFATTAEAYRYFISYNKIDTKLEKLFKNLDLKKLENVQKAGRLARKWISSGKFPEDLEKEIIIAYKKLEKEYGKNTDVAVRSSATAEDLPDASFAGQHESYLNVSGEKQLLKSVKSCFSSLFTDRAISYRREKGFKQLEVYLSVCIQKMVRSDLASSGIMFTIDTETGFDKSVVINSIWGVGELIVKGRITPDRFFVFKNTLTDGYKSIISKSLGRKNRKLIYSPKGGLKEVAVPKKDHSIMSITDEEVITLAKWGCAIENHYGNAQDIEWAKDGKTGKLFIVQSRPETVHSNESGHFYTEYMIDSPQDPALYGVAIGNKIGTGKVRVILDPKDMKDFKEGEVLITKMTDPDWNSIMTIAGAVITDEGGKTCHSAIISRELGIPCIVGSKKATKMFKTGDIITVDCTQGLDGRIFRGKIPYTSKRYNLDKIPDLKTDICLNIGAPDIAFKYSYLPVDGVGLAREEFIIANKIMVHPLVLSYFDKVKSKLSKEEKKKIEEITFGYTDKKKFFVDKLAEGVAQIGAAFYPKKVIVRFSDFKTNEYRNLIGGRLFEGEEQNPMMGFRGASRYIDPEFQKAFKLECEAIKKAREEFGLNNICVMVPFCRTLEEGKQSRDLIKKFGLTDKKMPVYVMCEIPANVILANEFLDIFDGFSIGSNDLTQLTLGLDRDNGGLSYIGDERDEAVMKLIDQAITACKKRKKYCGICGQAPSDYPEFAEFIMKKGVSSISLNPDSVIKTIIRLSSLKKTKKFLW